MCLDQEARDKKTKGERKIPEKEIKWFMILIGEKLILFSFD